MPDHPSLPARPRRRTVLAALGTAPLGAVLPLALAGAGADTAAATDDPDELFEYGRFAAADAGYRRILSRRPDDAHALAQRGYIALLSNRFDDAERFLAQALDLAPDDTASMRRLADCYVRQNDAGRAAPLLRDSGQRAKAAQYTAMPGRPFEPDGDAIARLPLLHLDPLPVLEASCNGHRSRYLFDTGATLIIGQSTADTTGIEVLASEELLQGGDRHVFNFGIADSFALGGLMLRHVPVMWNDGGTIELPEVPGSDEQPSGVIGTTLLSHVLATLDYGRRELVVRHPTTSQRRAFRAEAVRSGASLLPFWMAPDHFLYAPGTVNGHGPHVCSVDTGGPRIGLVVTPHDADRLGLDVDYDTEEHFFGRTVHPIDSAPVGMGKIRRTVPGYAGELNFSLQRSGFRSLGNISHEFFRPLAFTFDFVDMRLSLARTARS